MGEVEPKRRSVLSQSGRTETLPYRSKYDPYLLGKVEQLHGTDGNVHLTNIVKNILNNIVEKIVKNIEKYIQENIRKYI